MSLLFKKFPKHSITQQIKTKILANSWHNKKEEQLLMMAKYAYPKSTDFLIRLKPTETIQSHRGRQTLIYHTICKAFKLRQIKNLHLLITRTQQCKIIRGRLPLNRKRSQIEKNCPKYCLIGLTWTFQCQVRCKNCEWIRVKPYEIQSNLSMLILKIWQMSPTNLKRKPLWILIELSRRESKMSRAIKTPRNSLPISKIQVQYMRGRRLWEMRGVSAAGV